MTEAEKEKLFALLAKAEGVEPQPDFTQPFGIMVLPDYFDDRNLWRLHKIEAGLTEYEWIDYTVCLRDQFGGIGEDDLKDYIHASAEQKAIALGKVLEGGVR